MSVKIKICGIMRGEDIAAVNAVLTGEAFMKSGSIRGAMEQML